MSEDCHDSNNFRCGWCDGDHLVEDCPDLAGWREYEREQEMDLEAVYYDIPGAAESF